MAVWLEGSYLAPYGFGTVTLALAITVTRINWVSNSVYSCVSKSSPSCSNSHRIQIAVFRNFSKTEDFVIRQAKHDLASYLRYALVMRSEHQSKG